MKKAFLLCEVKIPIGFDSASIALQFAQSKLMAVDAGEKYGKQSRKRKKKINKVYDRLSA